MTTTRAKSKKAAPDICPEISNKISIREALSIIEATRQNVLEVFLLSSNHNKLPLVATEAISSSLAVSSSVASIPTKNPKVFNNRPVNKLVFSSIDSTLGAASTTSSKKMILDEISIALSSISSKMGQDQSLAVLPNVVSSGGSLPVLKTKQSSPVGSPVFENWADQIETDLFSPLVSGAIKLAHIKAVFQSVHGFLGAKSVSKDNMKLFCVEFASQVELTSFVHLATFKIAKSLVISESGSFSAAVALHDVPLGVFAANIKTVLSVFGNVTCVMLKSAGVWQYIVTILSRDKFKAKLVNLSSGCTAFEIMATTPDTTTLEYYQSIYTHCKQRFNIPDGIEVVKKSVYQYIENYINNYLFGNYNISKVRNNLYNNLVHYLQLGTEDLNSETLVIYFQELNFNIIEYCEEKYPVQPKYFFESETETSNKDKQKVKQYSKTTPNTPILSKTTAKHLQTPEQGTSVKLPLSITLFPILLFQSQTPSSLLNHFSRPEDFHANIIDYLQENESNHSESLESEKTESEPEKITGNKKEMTTAYIAKIPEFTGKNNDTSSQEWLDKVQKAEDANGWIAARMLKTIPYFLQETAREWFENLEKPFENWQAFKDAFLQQFTDNNTFITLRNHFHNIKQKTSKTVMTYLERFNKLFRRIRQLETNDYYSNTQILDQFIAGLKDKLIKKVCPHALADLATAIRHAKSYEIAIEKANHTKLVNLAIGETSSAAEEKIDQLTKKQQYQQSLPIQSYQIPPTQQYQVSARKLVQHNQFTFQNQLQKESDFQQTALSESEVVASRSNPSNHTILLAQIAQNANLSDIFPFEFEANESPFLVSNTAVNKQKAITAMYTEATREKKPICLILDSGLAESIITYQLMQQLKQNVDRPAQTVIVTADEKALVFEFEEEKKILLTETYMGLGSPSNWAEETEQEIFKELRGWKKVRYSTPEPQKEPLYILLKCKDCKKKLSSMGACISPEKEYKTHTCYFYKACHRE
ncbi:hypothetical protein G9A89_004219 [Geosiphon pyriformis]|nr:hypothetical protein G9A89_004219 [Geosiphon pyriformis]